MCTPIFFLFNWLLYPLFQRLGKFNQILIITKFVYLKVCDKFRGCWINHRSSWRFVLFGDYQISYFAFANLHRVNKVFKLFRCKCTQAITTLKSLKSTPGGRVPQFWNLCAKCWNLVKNCQKSLFKKYPYDQFEEKNL